MTLTGAPRSRAAGFTLIELMVVVAILGVTAALVVRGFKSNPTGSEARRLASLMSTAYRTAISGGPVRAEVAAATGGTRARVMLEITASGDGYVVTVWKLDEDDPPSTGFTWRSVETAGIAPEVEIVRIADTATLSMSATEITAGGIPAQKFYYPNGAADGFTIYLRSRYNDGLTRFRVVGLPLSPTPQVFEDW